MSKTVTVQARMEPKLKDQANKILAGLGINASTAITLFYTQLVRQQGIPIELKVPNADTLMAMEELNDADYREKTTKFKSLDELFEDLNA